MLHKEQIKELVEILLDDYGMGGDSAVNLILGTMAQESAFGKYLWQLNDERTAKGFIQMEEATEQDIWDNYLRYRPEIVKKIKEMSNKQTEWL